MMIVNNDDDNDFDGSNTWKVLTPAVNVGLRGSELINGNTYPR